MRVLADANFLAAAVAALPAIGHEVQWTGMVAPATAAAAMPALAVCAKRIILAFDEDFGELSAGASQPDESGVMLFRRSRPNAESAGHAPGQFVSNR
jgi:predicted nuclease of predicted toxin-antitoxin system